MHIGIIPDGNRRWAKRRHSSLHQAYAIGFRNVIDLALQLPKFGFRHLTFYGLTHSNYIFRPSDQVESLLSQIIDSLVVEAPLLLGNGIRIKFFGPIEQFRIGHRIDLDKIEQSTASLANPVADMNVLINYSPEWDLRAGAEHLATQSIPACDFIFRSGRVKRLSGFLPMQSAYAQLYFSSKLWPDVRPDDVLKVASKLSKMRRKFGA
jgi:undecaprenyl diphosphate synthase